MHDIFLSYRRSDTAGYAQLLYWRLRERYGEDVVFFDRASIESGTLFPRELEEGVAGSKALLAAIGPGWLDARDPATGKRRLDDPNDFVRREVAQALRGSSRVIPILFHDAPLPSPHDLPPELRDLTKLQAHFLRGSDAEFEASLQSLFAVLEDPKVGIAKGLDLPRLLRRPYRPIPSNPTLSQLLHPSHGVVPLLSAEATVTDAVRWITDGGRVLLFSGPGGIGKTRLLAETCARLAAQGWDARFLQPAVPLDSRDLSALLDTRSPRVIAVDYAETKPDLVRQLVDSALNASQANHCLLLGARSEGSWWKRLLARHGGNSSSFRSMPLAVAAEVPVESRDEAFANAETAFVSATGLPRALGPRPDLSAATFQRVFYIHLAAAINLASGGNSDSARILQAAIAREDEYLTAAATQRGLARPVAARLKVAMAWLALTGSVPATEAALVKVLESTDLFRGVDRPQLAEAAATLLALYAEGPLISGLRPDLLAEELVFEVASDNPSFLGLWSAAAEPEQVSHGLNLLARLANRLGSLPDGWIGGIVGLNLRERLPLALTALQTGGEPMARLLAAFLESLTLQPAEWFALLAEDADWTGPAALVGLQIHERLGPHAKPGLGQAIHLTNLAHLRFQVGDYEAARDRAAEAAAICTPAASNGDKQAAEVLIRALGNEAAALRELGEAELAITASRKAIALRRNTVQNEALLVRQLTVFGELLGDVGQWQEAIATGAEAVNLAERPNSDDNEALSALASALDSLANHYSEVEAFSAALPLAQRSIAIRRTLVDRDRSTFAGELATGLSNYGNRLSDLGRSTEAFEAAEEGLRLDRELVRRSLSTYAPKLSRSLSNYSNRLFAVGRLPEAAAAMREAASIDRELFINGHGSDSELGVTLMNLAIRLVAVDEYSDAKMAASQSVELLRKATRVRPMRWGPSLARALSIQAEVALYFRSGSGALNAIDEAIGLLEPLFRSSPNTFAVRAQTVVGCYLKICSFIGMSPNPSTLGSLWRLI